MADVKPRGRFVWFDLMTTEPEAAIAFYNKVTGWGTRLWEGPIPYTMWTNGGVPLAGVMRLPADAGAPPHWLAYISTPDADKTVQQTTARGGRVVMTPSEIPTVGRIAVLADPQGAMFAVFTPEGTAPGHEGPPEHGEFSWHELMTTDAAAAWTFYEALFGWEKTSAMDMGSPLGVYQMYGRAGVELGGMFRKPPQTPGPPSWLHYILVHDVQRTVETIQREGGQIVQPPIQVPGGDWIAQATDPQGALFAVHSRTTAESN